MQMDPQNVQIEHQDVQLEPQNVQIEPQNGQMEPQMVRQNVQMARQNVRMQRQNVQIELQKVQMERQKKLHVGNMCKDKYVSKHEKSRPSDSAQVKETKDEKVKVAAFKEDFVDGYEGFIEQNRSILMEYAAIDEDDEASEQFVLKHTQLLSEHATGFYLLHCINLQARPRESNLTTLRPHAPCRQRAAVSVACA